MSAAELDRVIKEMFGSKVCRGGALAAKPDEAHRRRIQTFKRTRAMRERQEVRGKDVGWGDHPFGSDFDEDPDDRDAALEGLFAASRKNGPNGKRPKGYAPWRPQGKTVAIIAQIKEVLDEYRAELPLTARQIFYRMVGAYAYPKDERAYERLTNILVRARRARIVPFDSIRDDGASVMACAHYAGEEEFYKHVRELGKRYEKNKLANQKVDIRIYCEAAGMMPQISRVSSRYSVPVYSCSGYDSLTAKYDLAQDIVSAYTYRGRRTVVLHLGDHDPSGENILDVIAEDVHKFVGAHVLNKDPGDVALFSRVALTEELIREHDLPTAPPKRTDSRSKRWGGRETCQVEALPPNVLANVLADAIEGYLDQAILKADREAAERRNITLALPAGTV